MTHDDLKKIEDQVLGKNKISFVLQNGRLVCSVRRTICTEFVQYTYNGLRIGRAKAIELLRNVRIEDFVGSLNT